MTQKPPPQRIAASGIDAFAGKPTPVIPRPTQIVEALLNTNQGRALICARAGRELSGRSSLIDGLFEITGARSWAELYGSPKLEEFMREIVK